MEAGDGAHADAPAPQAESVTSNGELHAAEEHEVHEDHEDDDDHDHDHEAAAPEPPREKPEPPAIGAVFKGRVGAVAESGHIAILNRIVDTKAVREQLGQFREQHKRVHGMVFGFNRGGFDVLVEGLRAFCPASAMSLEDIAEPLEFVGKKLEFLLPASKAGSKDIIVSRRSILERLQRRKTKEFLRGLTPGQRFKGKVTAVRDFGLFVDIGGVEGLVHQSELSYAFGVKPSAVAKVGDEIEVQILRVGGEPNKQKESGKKERLTRVSLSVKALLPDPWDAHAEALSEGAIHKGKVVRAAEFGAFVEIVPEVEGLLHITELGRDLKHANQAVKEGDEIYVAIERIDRRARRISLSKLSPAEVQEFEAGGLTRDDAAARNLRQGQNVKIKIERIEPRCVFGRVTGTVGRRGRAFMPNSETGTERGTDLRKRFPIGSEVEAKIIGLDRDGSLKCSIKAMQIDEERQAVKNYRREAAKQGFGTFGDLLRAKLGEAQK
jgi:small subunit ribosomal protein S1